MNKLTQDRLKEVLFYNTETGIFTWLVKKARWLNVGDMAGVTGRDGRIAIGVDRKHYLAHRLAWLYVYGHFPTQVIDHIDGNPSNNRLANLRDVPQWMNAENHRRARSNAKSGLLGVTKRTYSRGYVAAIQVRGKFHYLGSFLHAEDAHQAYLVAKRKLHEGCTL